MERDPVRQKLKDLLWKRGLTMAAASVALGRNRAYMHQYLERGLPKVLNYPDSVTLGELLDCDPAELRHETVPKRKPAKRTRRIPPAGIPGVPLSAIPEMEIDAAAGPGALNEEFATEKARWYLPEVMVRHEADANPEGLRILRVRGNSMEPEMSAGDRIVVDTARRIPATGEMAVLWDGNGLVVKRIETVREPGPPQAAIDLRQPGLCALYLPRPGSAHRRQGAVDHQASVNGGGTKAQPARLSCRGTATASWPRGSRPCASPGRPGLHLISANPDYTPITHRGRKSHEWSGYR